MVRSHSAAARFGSIVYTIKGQVFKMSDTYVECLVKAKAPAWGKLLKILLIVLTAVFAVVMLMIPYVILLAVAAGVGVYFAGYLTDVEYEYLYLDRELVVDKVMAKSKRKRVASYSLDRIEVFAPVKSYHLDNYRNRTAQVVDYSIGEELQPDRRFAMYYEGGKKIILSPSEELVKVMKNAAPRKIFSD